ncbi:MAG: cell division protein FtsX [Actinobacteria bacterium HGW-Actinobacteria-5]|nr:MAG: cell division protein FtsX [Actinobacteria bacterium HGW-Actinobacteria-5]
MSILGRTLWRDARARAGQFIALTVTVALGVALFGASYDAFGSLTASYRGLYDRLAMADLIATGGPTGQIADEGRRLDGVAAASARTVGETAMKVGDHRQYARIVGLPSDGNPAVDKVMVLSGTGLDPTRSDQALVEQHLAGALGLEPGATVDVATATGWATLHVAGIVASPEYLWPARSRQEPIVPFDQWGVLFATQKVVDELPAGQVEQQALFVHTTDAPADTDARLRELALGLGASSTQTLAEQPSEATLNEDITGFGEMSVAFPVLFLLAAGLGVSVLLSRLIAQQRSQIGVLRASGFARSRIRRHYLSFGLAVGIVGSVLGAVVGALAAASITRLYTAAISVPVTVIEVRPLTVAIGVLMGPIAGGIAAYLPSARAARIEPAEAMRGNVPAGGGRLSWAERLVPPLRRLPVRWLAALRDLGRNPRRSISTVIGVALAAMLVLVSWGMIDTVQILLGQQFLTVQHQDATVQLMQPRPVDDLSRLDVDGVSAVEPELSTPVTLINGGHRYATTLTGLRPDTTMHTFASSGGTALTLPASGGVLLATPLRPILDVAVGDTIEVDAGSGHTARLRVAGFTEEPLGAFGYASLATVSALTGQSGPTMTVSSALVRFEPGADRAAVITRLTGVEGVAVALDAQELYDLAQKFMGLFYVFAGVMLALGAVMAFALIFVTMTTNVSERAVELASLRTLGMSRPRVSRLVTAENLILIVVGLVPGLALGYATAAAFMSSFSSDLFQFDLRIRPATFVITAAAILAVGLVSQVPALRSIGRIDLGLATRQRAS